MYVQIMSLSVLLCNVCVCYVYILKMSKKIKVKKKKKKTDRHDITEILVKVALNTITLNPHGSVTNNKLASS